MCWEMLSPLDGVRARVEGADGSQLEIHSPRRGCKGFSNP